MKKVIVSVTNDLSTDQRVDKVCSFLFKLGFDVTLVGRRKRNSSEIEKRQYQTERMILLFEKGPLFYIEFNIRLFFYLLRSRADLLVSNDLDTLLANFLAKKILKSEIVYDSHEFYTETPELINRPVVQNVWKQIEKFIFPKLKNVITVNQSIADMYKSEYGVDVKVVRNIPSKIWRENTNFEIEIKKKKLELGLTIDKKIVLLQGAGINIERGAEEAVQAMKFVGNAVLLIIGGGDVINILKKFVVDNNLNDKVIFINKMSYEKLRQYTVLVDIGLTLDKDTNINYRFSLPNKIFDYIHSEVPILSSRLVEISKIIEKYNIGEFIDNHEPQHIASKINLMLSDIEKNKIWKANLKVAADELCWENEEIVLIEVYNQFI